MPRFLFFLAALLLSAPLAHAQDTISLISDRTEFNGTWQAMGTRLLASGADTTEATTAYALQLRLTIAGDEPSLEGGEQRILRMPANAFGDGGSAQTQTYALRVSGTFAPEAGRSRLTFHPLRDARAVVFDAHLTSDSRLVLTPVDNEHARTLVYRRVDAFATR